MRRRAGASGRASGRRRGALQVGDVIRWFRFASPTGYRLSPLRGAERLRAAGGTSAFWPASALTSDGPPADPAQAEKRAATEKQHGTGRLRDGQKLDARRRVVDLELICPDAENRAVGKAGKLTNDATLAAQEGERLAAAERPVPQIR